MKKKLLAITLALVIMVLSIPQPAFASEEGIFGDMGVIGVLLNRPEEYTAADFPGIDIEQIKYYASKKSFYIILKEKTIRATDDAMEVILDVIGDNVSFAIQQYKTIAVGATMFLNGDADGDWDCDLVDVSLTLKYIAGWDVTFDNYALRAVDIYRDQKIKLVDVTIMMKKIAGWPQSEWLPKE